MTTPHPEDRVAHRAYPELQRSAEIFGIHKMCFELGAVFGYCLFYFSKNLPITLMITFFLMLFINYFLKKDPAYFQIRRKAVRIHYASLGYFRAVSSPGNPLRTLTFME